MNIIENNNDNLGVSSRHHKIMRDLVVFGMKAREAATINDITESQLSILRKSPIWKIEERKMREEVLEDDKRKMGSLRGDALEVLEDAMDSDMDMKHRIAGAKEVLSRGGMPAGVIVEERVEVNAHMYSIDIASIRREKEEIYKALGEGAVEAIEAEIVAIEVEEAHAD